MREFLTIGLPLLVVAVMIFDLRGWQRFLRRYHQLNHEGRLEELEEVLLQEMRTIRPFIRPVMRFKFPGGLENFYSNQLFLTGRTAEALERAEKGAQKAGLHKRLLPDALNLQVLCLTELGRYDEARAVAARSRSVGSPHGADVVESRIALMLGRLDEAIEIGTRAAADRRGYVGRCTASVALNCKGNAEGALALLQENPPGIWVHYTDRQLKALERTSSGRELLDLHQKQWSGVLEPLRFLYAGLVYAELKDLDALRFALDKAGASMGGLPAVRAMHKMLELLLHAGRGDKPEAERCLKEGRELLNGLTTRATKAEFHRSAGRAFLALGRAADAVPEFEAALAGSVHPLEKHINRFWLARAQDARGDKAKAAELFQSVAADGIASKYAAEAALFRP
jgi:tetratricopeptide (TPR) repeat protein